MQRIKCICFSRQNIEIFLDTLLQYTFTIERCSIRKFVCKCSEIWVDPDLTGQPGMLNTCIYVRHACSRLPQMPNAIYLFRLFSRL